MEEQQMNWGSNDEPTYRSTDWIIFFISLIAMLALLQFADRYFWIALPFVCTFLVRALKVM